MSDRPGCARVDDTKKKSRSGPMPGAACVVPLVAGQGAGLVPRVGVDWPTTVGGRPG